jgi:Xaa-Pro aminopeptidase
VSKEPKAATQAVLSEQRVSRLAGALAQQQLDIYLATNTSDIRWLTNLADVFDDEQAHLALVQSAASASAAAGAVASSTAADTPAAGVTAAGTLAADTPVAGATAAADASSNWLFTDTRYSGALRQLTDDGSWRIFDERSPRFPAVAEKLAEIASAGLDSQGSGQGELRIGIEADLRLDWFRALSKALAAQSDASSSFKAELVEVKDLITVLRAKKDATEIAAMRAAQAITDAAFAHILEYIRPGLTEREVAMELEFCMRRSGADGNAFAPIVAFGPNSAIPHATPSKRILQPGDFVLLDFGARLGDYRSDMTRTLVVGQASQQQQQMYAAVLAAQSAVIAALKPGVQGQQVQQIAEKIIAEHGFEGKFIHSLGHGVGIDIHELPTLAPKTETELEPGNVVTVEPGVYINGIGGVRIEDFGVITEQGFDNFTQSPHELIIL